MYTIAMLKLNARQLRTLPVDPIEAKAVPKHDITIILDNVLDTYNVGSIFRLADSIAAKKVILCGQTLTPPNSRIKKASINTWQWVDWDYAANTQQAILDLKNQNSELKVIAVEQDQRSSLFYNVKYELPLAIVVGNESTGVSKDVLDVVDMIVELPMWGINVSLNVMVSCGIILYEIMKQYEQKITS